MLPVPGVPFPLTPSPPEAWRPDGPAGGPVAAAPAGTDLYVDPAGTDSAGTGTTGTPPTLLGAPPEGDYQLGARVTVDFRSAYDAGALLLHVDDTTWAKLCFERSPAGEAMIVSVVTRGVSDDANAVVVPGRSVWLRVSRLGPAYAYHFSTDGGTWQLVRVFSLGAGPAAVGFEGQSPTGDGCTVTFDEVRFVPERLAELRDGS